MGEWLERYKAYIVSGLALLIAAGLLVFWRNRPQQTPITISTPLPTATPTCVPTPTPAPVRVYVTGAVHRPDVYVLSPGSIVKDAIAAAGGATDEADLNRINLAVQVNDQQQVYVPCQGEDTPPVAPSAADAPPAVTAAGPININTASVEELDALPGIGPAFAQRIVDYRTAYGPFVTPEDLIKVKGIGPTTFEKLADQITVR